MAYLLDANVFIQAKNLQYGFDFCPAFWDWLVQAHGKGRVRSVRQVNIPNVCVGLGIEFMSPYQMLRREQARFVLAP